MTRGARLDAWLDFSRDNTRLQQFGQKDDESTWGGATGCTQTILQRLIKAKTGDYYSHDEISRIASYPWPENNPTMRGMWSGGGDNEVGRVLAHFNLPYQIVTGWSFDAVREESDKGPVMLAIRYGYWPEDRGYSYHGVKADGRPGGFAIKGGKTQLVGFDYGYHATLWLGRRTVSGQHRSYANEPNHGSESRPERPDFDVILTTQARRAYKKYGSTGRRLLAWVPTKAFSPKGY